MSTGQSRSSRSRACLTGAVALAVLVASTGVRSQTPPLPSPLLVLPFDGTPRDPRLIWLQEAAAVLLADELNAHGANALRRDERIRAFQHLNLPTGTTLTQATVIKVGQVVGASEVIVGSVALAGDRLTVRARSIRLDAGRIRSEVVEHAPTRELFPLIERVARLLFPDRLRLEHTAAEARPRLDAFEQYIRGLLEASPDARLKRFHQALQLDPSFHRVRLAVWEAHTDAGRHAEALASVAVVPPDSRTARQARFRAGLSELSLGRDDAAFTTFKALNDEQPVPATLNNLGLVQLRRGWTPTTGRPTYYFTKAAEADPTDADYCFNLGYAYWAERDYTAAIYWLREAVRRDPADGDAHYVLGAALQASPGTGPRGEAGREFELARQLSSRYEEGETKAPADAVPKGLARVKSDLDTPQTVRIERAILSGVEREQRELAGFHLASGRRLFEAERDQDAIAELRRSIFLTPYQSEAHLLLGRAYLRTGRLGDAIAAFKIAIWSEETVAARVLLGEAYLQGHDLAAARAEAERALVLDPGSVTARSLLDRIAKPEPR